MDKCKWLPETLEEPDWNNYSDYEDSLYNYYINYIYNKLYFNGEKVSMRQHPKTNGKFESFYHITCKDFNNSGERNPDPHRMIRINWIQKILDNTPCTETCCSDKPLYWKKEHSNNKLRHKFYFKNYLIVLEDRIDYMLFITAYYVEEEYRHRGLLKEYSRYRDN